MSTFRTTRAARRDLRAIFKYIAKDDERAAIRWQASLLAQFQVLSSQPLVGVSRQDLAPSLRLMPFGNYLLFYQPIPDGVLVARVVHGSRNYSARWFRRLDS